MHGTPQFVADGLGAEREFGDEGFSDPGPVVPNSEILKKSQAWRIDPYGPNKKIINLGFPLFHLNLRPSCVPGYFFHPATNEICSHVKGKFQ